MVTVCTRAGTGNQIELKATWMSLAWHLLPARRGFASERKRSDLGRIGAAQTSECTPN